MAKTAEGLTESTIQSIIFSVTPLISDNVMNTNVSVTVSFSDCDCVWGNWELLMAHELPSLSYS